MNEELRDEVARVLSWHRVNFHVRNVGGNTSSELRYTSCDGCDWLGGHHDEAGWEAHIADTIMHLLERREREAWRTSRLDLAHELRESGAWSEVRMAEWVEMRADRAALTSADASTEETP